MTGLKFIKYYLFVYMNPPNVYNLICINSVISNSSYIKKNTFSTFISDLADVIKLSVFITGN